MSDALPSALLVSALLKRVNDAGGMGMVRARGDGDSGAILLILNDPPGISRLMERALDPMGKPMLIGTGPADTQDLVACEAYWRKRRDRDPDLWVVELDIASAERFAAENDLRRLTAARGRTIGRNLSHGRCAVPGAIRPGYAVGGLSGWSTFADHVCAPTAF